jgi:hypothetical protein
MHCRGAPSSMQTVAGIVKDGGCLYEEAAETQLAVSMMQDEGRTRKGARKGKVCASAQAVCVDLAEGCRSGALGGVQGACAVQRSGWEGTSRAAHAPPRPEPARTARWVGGLSAARGGDESFKQRSMQLAPRGSGGFRLIVATKKQT